MMTPEDLVCDLEPRPFNARTMTALRNENPRMTVGELVTMYRNGKLAYLRNIGALALSEICHVLADAGLIDRTAWRETAACPTCGHRKAVPSR